MPESRLQRLPELQTRDREQRLSILHRVGLLLYCVRRLNITISSLAKAMGPGAPRSIELVFADMVVVVGKQLLLEQPLLVFPIRTLLAARGSFAV